MVWLIGHFSLIYCYGAIVSGFVAMGFTASIIGMSKSWTRAKPIRFGSGNPPNMAPHGSVGSVEQRYPKSDRRICLPFCAVLFFRLFVFFLSFRVLECPALSSSLFLLHL